VDGVTGNRKGKTMSEEVLKILLSILAAVLSGGVGILTIYLRKRWQVEDLSRAVAIVEQAVRAVEAIGAAAGWDSDTKKAEAIARASAQLRLPEADLADMVEAAVARLKAAKEELTKRGGAVVLKA
jgi:hypothetical protein